MKARSPFVSLFTLILFPSATLAQEMPELVTDRPDLLNDVLRDRGHEV